MTKSVIGKKGATTRGKRKSRHVEGGVEVSCLLYNIAGSSDEFIREAEKTWTSEVE